MTLGSGVPTTPKLGGGWDCNIQGLNEPTCSKDGTQGRHLRLLDPDRPPHLATSDVAFPLAVLTLDAIASGVDHLTLSDAGLETPGSGE